MKKILTGKIKFILNDGKEYFKNHLRIHIKMCIILILFNFILNFADVTAQPSGGPYGPIRQTYNLPKNAGKIFYVAVDGKKDQTGESLASPTTLESAIEHVKTGDVIVMRGGTYRIGNQILNQGIIIQPYADEQPILKGTYIADKWENLGNGLWNTKWQHLFPSKPDGWWQRNREGKKTPIYKFNNDMVFIDGKFLQAVGWEGEVNGNTYYIDYESGLVYIGTDPANKLVEISAYNSAIIRTTKECHGKQSDKKGYTIRGITFTQYAYRALEIEGTEPDDISDESKHGKEVVGTTLEHCTISFCSRVAGYFRGDKMTFRNCKISETSTEGIYIIASNDVLLEKNIFTHNNIENISGYYPAAVKIFNQSYRVTCRDNLIIDLPNSNGIWYDVGNVDGVFINNWIEGVGQLEKEIRNDQLWPSDNGFFFEISKNVICAGNVFVNCDHGLMILNASNAKIYNNTFVNSLACIGRNGRTPEGDHFGWHSATGPGIDKRDGHIFENNLLTGAVDFKRPLLFVWQPPSICEKISGQQLNEMKNNVFVRNYYKNSQDMIIWSPIKNKECQKGYESPDKVENEFPSFCANNRYFRDYNGPLFKGKELGNYELLSEFPGLKSASALPQEILKILGHTKKEGKYVGAYPAVQ